MRDSLFTLAELESVIPLVRASVSPTPQYAWPLLKVHTGVDIVVKHENHTPIGSFKVRGGIVYFDRLKRQRPKVRGIVTATRGNHGQSLAFAGSRAGIAVSIVVPHGNSTEKNAAMRSLGAELIEHVGVAAEVSARIGNALRRQGHRQGTRSLRGHRRYVLTSPMEAAVTWIFISAAITLVIAISSATDAGFPNRS
jgi:threonine dehydratase